MVREEKLETAKMEEEKSGEEAWREDEQRTKYCLLLICKNNSAAAWWRSKLGQRIPTERERWREEEEVSHQFSRWYQCEAEVSLPLHLRLPRLSVHIHPSIHPTTLLIVYPPHPSSTHLYITPVLCLYLLCLVPFDSLLINTASTLSHSNHSNIVLAEFLSRNQPYFLFLSRCEYLACQWLY